MPTSPVTGQQIPTRHLTPNHVVKQPIKQHLPDLAPPEVRLPVVQLLHVWHVQLILSFLDGKSLARCEGAWSSFLAAAEASQAWVKLLKSQFASKAFETGGNAAASARSRYAELKTAE